MLLNWVWTYFTANTLNSRIRKYSSADHLDSAIVWKEVWGKTVQTVRLPWLLQSGCSSQTHRQETEFSDISDNVLVFMGKVDFQTIHCTRFSSALWFSSENESMLILKSYFAFLDWVCTAFGFHHFVPVLFFVPQGSFTPLSYLPFVSFF